MKNVMKYGISIITAMILVIGVFALNIKEEDNPIIPLSEQSVSRVMNDVIKVYTVEQEVKDGKEKFKDYRTFLNVDIPFTSRYIDYVYDATIMAGYDFNDFKDYQIDHTNHTITITLPEADIHCDVAINKQKTISKNNLFNAIDIEFVEECKGKLVDKEINEAKTNGLIDKAEENVKTFVSDAFIRFTDYKVMFK